MFGSEERAGHRARACLAAFHDLAKMGGFPFLQEVQLPYMFWGLVESPGNPVHPILHNKHALQAVFCMSPLLLITDT